MGKKSGPKPGSQHHRDTKGDSPAAWSRRMREEYPHHKDGDIRCHFPHGPVNLEGKKCTWSRAFGRFRANYKDETIATYDSWHAARKAIAEAAKGKTVTKPKIEREATKRAKRKARVQNGSTKNSAMTPGDAETNDALRDLMMERAATLREQMETLQLQADQLEAAAEELS